ncbi:MAG TPA: hypothetical protein VKU00_33925 [Chthonomonadaceae bacterium]|nr:hypothetical protein [Chthonomonadaceae bacterium]
MSRIQGHEEETHAEILAARQAFKEQRYDDAEYHLNRATYLGAPQQQINELQKRIRNLRKTQRERAGTSGRWGFWCGILGYLLLSLQQPSGWTQTVWILLAFGLVPAIIALVVRWRQGVEVENSARFWTAWRAGSATMALYSVISLIIVGTRLGGDTVSGASHFIAGVLTMLLFALLAGSVAGLVCLLFGFRLRREGKHEPASR